MTTPTFGAILLAGGRASRVGGAVKPLFEVGGRTLLQAAVSAVSDAGAHPITVVAPMLDTSLVVDWVREEPTFAGPAAAVVAALDSWTGDDPDWTFVLACDLPRVGAAVLRLYTEVARLPHSADGLCLADAGSHPQWLTGLYRTSSLRKASSALADRGRDLPMRVLLADLSIVAVSAPDDTDDVDTWEDLKRAKERFDG